MYRLTQIGADQHRSVNMGPSGTPARGGSELPSGDDDTPLGGADFYELAVNGVPLVDWVTALMAGAPTRDV